MDQSECKWMVVRLIGMYCLVQAFLAGSIVISSYEFISTIPMLGDMDESMLAFVKSAEDSFRNKVISLLAYSLLGIFLEVGWLSISDSVYS